MASLKESLNKYDDLDTPVTSNEEPAGRTGPTAAAGRMPKLHSAPGGMAAFSTQLHDANESVRKLEEKLKLHEGSLPTKHVDAGRVRFSRSANRHEQHWKTPEFRSFKEELKASGGNVVPVLVRPVTGDSTADYEVTYGHRRTRACQDEGLPLLAIVQSMTDLEHWLAMARENMHREDLTPYELGDMYVNALRDKYFLNANELAKHFEKSRAHVSQAIKLRSLPQAILDAFPSPYDIQYRWSDELTERLATDSKATLELAKSLAKKRGTMSASEVFAALCPKPAKGRSMPVKAGDRLLGQALYANGRLQIQLIAKVVPEDKIPELLALVGSFIEKHPPAK